MMAREHNEGGISGSGDGTPGTVFVTFDAGGQGTAVDPNPIRALAVVEQAGTVGRIVWNLLSPKNNAPDWEAKICNVILCDVDDTPKDFQSTRGAGGKTWTWTWTPDSEVERLVFYDVFFWYGPKGTSDDERRHMPSVPIAMISSFRQITGLDPSILLPPVPMDPPHGGGGGGR